VNECVSVAQAAAVEHCAASISVAEIASFVMLQLRRFVLHWNSANGSGEDDYIQINSCVAVYYRFTEN